MQDAFKKIEKKIPQKISSKRKRKTNPKQIKKNKKKKNKQKKTNQIISLKVDNCIYNKWFVVISKQKKSVTIFTVNLNHPFLWMTVL